MFWINVENVYAKCLRPYWCVGSSVELPLRTPLVITNRSGREQVVWLSSPVMTDGGLTIVPKGVFVYHVMSNQEVVRLWAHMVKRAGEPGSKADRIIQTMDSLQAGLVAASSSLEKLVAALPKGRVRRPAAPAAPTGRGKRPAKKAPAAKKPSKRPKSASGPSPF